MAIGTIMAVASVAKGILGVFGGSKKKKAAKEQAKLNISLVKNRTQVQSLLSERSATKMIGGARADIGASGLQAAGSAADVLRESARDADFELSSIQKQGELEAKLIKAGGKASVAAAGIDQAGSIIGGITGVAKSGIFG